MKKLISLLMVVLTVFSMFPVSFAEEAPAFEGLVSATYPAAFTVTNSFGTTLTFAVSEGVAVPQVGSAVAVSYEGDITDQLVATAVTVEAASTQKTVSGAVASVTAEGFVVLTAEGALIPVITGDSTVISGKAETVVPGSTVTVTYAECVQALTTVNIAVSVDVTAIAAEKITEQNEKKEDTTNKTLSGTVVTLTDKKVTIKTSKGKKWTFKLNKHTQVRGKKLEVGAKCTITYDGYASQSPNAKRIKVTKSAPAPTPTTKKYSGVCCYFGNKELGIEGAQIHWVIDKNTKMTGKGFRGVGTNVTVTYYYGSDGMNHATKINWKAN